MSHADPTARVGSPRRLARAAIRATVVVLVLACTPAASPRPEPQFDPADLASARVSRAGRIEAGGMWASRRDALFTSVDGGRTWEPWPAPIPLRDGVIGPGIVVWDRDRAWAVESADSVARTVDGGRTWGSSRLPGGCDEWTGIAFATPDHGYLVCWEAGVLFTFVAETMDGGATWSVANPSARTASGWFGTRIVAAGPSNVWAVALDQDSGTQPLLAGSRDAGATWFEVDLPGVGSTYHGGGPILSIGPPIVAGDRLAVAAWDRSRVNADATLRVWESGDAGRTWSAVEPRNRPEGNRVAFVTPDHWIAANPGMGQVLVTLDAGRRWETIEAEGLPRGTIYGMTFSTATDGVIVAEAPDGDLMAPLVLLVTQDGGRTWRLANLDPGPSGRP